jgi:hypothetical protein
MIEKRELKIVKIIFVYIILGLLVSSCSSYSPDRETPTGYIQSQAFQPSDTPTPLPVKPTATFTKAVAHSGIISSTPQSSITVSAPILTETQAPTVIPTLDHSSTTNSQSAIVADHKVIAAFDSIPRVSISAAAAIKTLFMHQSTGDNIDYLGFQCLAGLNSDPSVFPEICTTYAQNPKFTPYDNRNWNWKLWDEPMANAINKTDQWVSVVNTQQSNYQALGMKFCYVDGWNQDFNYYRDMMLELERKYPDKIFIWSTSALWNEPGDACGNNAFNSCRKIAEFNGQVRAYAIANNKPLYDIADIESHDPDGNLCLTDGYEGLCDAYYTGYGGGGGGHPNVDGSIRLAKGFWWLMARISGWDGN